MNIQQALQHTTEALKAAGMNNPRQEARWLLAVHLGCDTSALYSRDDDLPESILFTERLAARCAHQPLSRIMGYRQFWKQKFHISPDVLDPRADSEWIIETALKLSPVAPKRILDLGTGSGCLLLSALEEFPKAHGIGVDYSSKALDVAQNNATRLGLAQRTSWLCQDWLSGWQAAPCDLILANPPYIPYDAELPKAVQEYDPALALFADECGMAAYQKILNDLHKVMQQDSLCIFECAPEQTTSLAERAIEAGFVAFSHLAQSGNIALHPAQQIGIVCVYSSALHR